MQRILCRRAAIAAAALAVFPCAPVMADVAATAVNPANGRTYLLVGLPESPGVVRGTTWLDAQTQAVYWGGNLVTINDAAEDAWVWATFEPQPTWDLWLGLNDLSSPGTFAWVSGESSGYQNWAGGEPNDDPNAGRVVAAAAWAAGQWMDVNRSHREPFGVVEVNPAYTRHEWNKPGGGVFGAAGNWTPAGPPGPSAGASFDLDSAYAVTFAADAQTYSALVERGRVTFNLGGRTYAARGAYVGKAGGSAELSIAGGTLQSTYAAIAMDSGSAGKVTVGAGGAWNSNQSFMVGDAGAATLDIVGGGQVSTANAIAAHASGSTAVITVSGAGSTWTDGGALCIGRSGNATMRVESEGALSAGRLTLGDGAGGEGLLTVTGAGSSLSTTDAADWLRVGESGTGTLFVVDRASASLRNTQIGGAWGGRGRVVISDPGTSVTVTGELTVGWSGDGEMEVRNGATLLPTGFAVGRDAWGSGRLAVDGATVANTGGNWFVVGWNGRGELAVTGGGQVNGASLHVGQDPTSSGRVTVAGAGSDVSLGAELVVGSLGAGSMSIDAGATATAPWAVIAQEEGSAGSLSVNGAGSSLNVNNGDLIAGNRGIGAFAVSDGALATVRNTVVIGNEPTGVGQAVVRGAGSRLEIPAGGLRVGQSGHGTLRIREGGEVVLGAGDVYIGGGEGASGEVVISGEGSSLALNQMSITVGDWGRGALTVENGAALEGVRYVNILSGGEAPCAMTVSGAGTDVSIAEAIGVGINSAGELRILDGATVTAPFVNVGPDPNGDGRVILAGHGTLLDVPVHGVTLDKGQLVVGEGATLRAMRVYASNWGIGGQIVMEGGTIVVQDGVRFDFAQRPLVGHGAIRGYIYHDLPGGIIASGGTLILGDPTLTNGFSVIAPITVESDSTLELLDRDIAEVHGEMPLTLHNGVLVARNGVALWGADPVGHGILIGNCNRIIAQPDGVVSMTQAIDVGASTARVYSTGVADLGKATTLGGGSLIAPRGIRLGDGDRLAGFGLVQASTAMANALIEASDGRTLMLAGDLSGHGVVVGDVRTPFDIPGEPDGKVALAAPLALGARSAMVHSRADASLGPAVTMAGGTLAAPCGLKVAAGQSIDGYGTVRAHVNLAGGILRADPVQPLVVDGNISGYGLLLNGVTFQSQYAIGSVNLTTPFVFVEDDVEFMSAGPATISTWIGLANAMLSSSQGLVIAPDATLNGFGTIATALANNGLVEPTGEGFCVESSFTQVGGEVRGTRIVLAGSARFTGAGTVGAEVEGLAGSSIVATGDLVLGDRSSYDGFVTAGTVSVGSSILTLLDADSAVLAGPTVIGDGTLNAPSGVYNAHTGEIVMTFTRSYLRSTAQIVNDGRITGRGALRGAAGIVNNASFVFSGVTDLFGDVTNGSGADILVTGGGPTTFFNAVQNEGEIRVSEGSTAVFLGPVTGDGAFSGAGIKVFEGGLSVLGGIITDGATVVQPAAVLEAPLIQEQSLTVRGELLLTGSDEASVLHVLSIDLPAVMDLGGSALILHGDVETAPDRLAAVLDQIARARNGDPDHLWAGAGLTSSLAAADPLMGVGAIISQADGSFHGQPAYAGSVLVAYAFNGDANLDGLVDGRDYFAADRGFLRGLGDWADGNFDYLGGIDGDDFFLLDRSFLGQGADRPGAAAVPEPGGVMGILAATLLAFCSGRRRRN